MIDGIGKTGSGRVDLTRPGLERGGAIAAAGTSMSGTSVSVGGAVGELVSAGPPVDGGKVAAIRSAIAEGRYPVDPSRIADAMLALDLPAKA